jgi:hypothetical protein
LGNFGEFLGIFGRLGRKVKKLKIILLLETGENVWVNPGTPDLEYYNYCVEIRKQ